MHLATLVAVTLVGAAGVLAWRARIALPAAVDLEPTLPLSDATQIQRTNWMSVAGAAISLWFIVVILSMEIPILVLGECQ
jgi:hypothetical protein